MKATLWLQVRDLERSTAFYCDQVGFEPVRTGDGAALVKHRFGAPLLLVGPGAGDVTEFLAERHRQAEPNKLIYLDGASVDLKASLVGKGLQVTWTQAEWGDLELFVTDPDGYTLCFWGSREMAAEEVLLWYQAAPDRLERALRGLSEADLDLTRAPGKWSIRQLTHHIVDSDCLSLARTKFALAEPGRNYQGNAYNPDVWAEGLHYANRPVEPAVLLFRGIRAHMFQLLTHLPGALERTTVGPDGTASPVGPFIRALMGHALHHISQIEETRRLHGK